MFQKKKGRKTPEENNTITKRKRPKLLYSIFQKKKQNYLSWEVHPSHLYIERGKNLHDVMK
jgi:hypothetical protein